MMAATNPQTKASVDKAEVFRVLRYTPHPGQILVHNSSARFRVLASGARFGKSTAAAMEVVVALLFPAPATLGWVCAPTVELTSFVMDRVRIAFLDRLPYRVVEDDQRSQRLVIRNLAGGLSELRAKSTDSPSNLLGAALDFLVVDESARVRDEVWESFLSPRLIDRKGWALVISTPRGAKGWFYEAWRRGQQGRDADFESWRAPTLSNPHLPSEVVEAERKRMSAESFAQEFEAQFIDEPEDQCTACGNPSDSGAPDIMFADYESEPRCALCAGIVDGRGRTRVVRYRGRGTPIVIDGGQGLRSRLLPGEDFATEVAKLRAELDRGRSSQ